jgi:16S rRNA (cytosine967-C5)-methyltransferase
MTPRPPPSARVRAVEVLRDVLERGGRATAQLAPASRGLSPQDGDLLREIVLGVLRNRARLDAEIAAVSRVPLPRLAPNLREILEVALYQVRFLDRVPAYAAVDEAVAHAKASGGAGAAGLVNAILRTLLRKPPRDLPLPPKGRGEGATGATALALRFSHPEFLVQRWLARFGETVTLQILEADNSPSGVDLLTNTRRTDRDSLAAALLAEGVSTSPSTLSPLALTVLDGNPFRSPLFAVGHFSVQDAGSQALPLLLPPGDTLVDLAAAPGGKSFSAVLHGRARSAVALDRSVDRLSLLVENRARLGIFEVLPAAGDILAAPLPPRGSERVLYDAPCSGTGTLRKNPEIRYRVTAEAIERLARAQEAGLSAAADLLAPGGVLLYSTCSLEEEENERVVERVLARRPEIEPAAMAVSGGLAAFVAGNRFRLLPASANDGFTAHLLRRRASQPA